MACSRATLKQRMSNTFEMGDKYISFQLYHTLSYTGLAGYDSRHLGVDIILQIAIAYIRLLKTR